MKPNPGPMTPKEQQALREQLRPAQFMDFKGRVANAMTADEIRASAASIINALAINCTHKSSPEMLSASTLATAMLPMLSEIAAQLSELNEHLRSGNINVDAHTDRLRAY